MGNQTSKAVATTKATAEPEYTKGLQKPQEYEDQVSKTAHTLANALTTGIEEYRKNRKTSAEAKKDGALTDLFLNVGKGLTAGAEAGAKVFTHFGETLDLLAPSKKQREAFTKPFESFYNLFPFIFDEDEDEDED